MMSKVKVIVDGVEYEVEVEELAGGTFRVEFNGKTYEVKAEGLGIAPEQMSLPSPRVQRAPAPTPQSVPVQAPQTAAQNVEGAVTAPMPGKILKVLVKEGDRVKTGQGVLILEAMKMENEIPAPRDGVVKRVLVKEGDTVDTGQPLVELG